MILWDVIEKINSEQLTIVIAKIPNGNPLPVEDDEDTEWVRTYTAVSGDEADHIIDTVSKRKC